MTVAVILCGFHDNWVRPPIKPTSAVISSPKSFVIALICILQLSALAHSKNNQPPLKTGASIIIISVDLYKTLLTSHCLTSALCCRASFVPYFRKNIYIHHRRRWVMRSDRSIYSTNLDFCLSKIFFYPFAIGRHFFFRSAVHLTSWKENDLQ